MKFGAAADRVSDIELPILPQLRPKFGEIVNRFCAQLRHQARRAAQRERSAKLSGFEFEDGLLVSPRHSEHKVCFGDDSGRQLTGGKVGRFAAEPLKDCSRLGVNWMSNHGSHARAGGSEVGNLQLSSVGSRQSFCYR